LQETLKINCFVSGDLLLLSSWYFFGDAFVSIGDGSCCWDEKWLGFTRIWAGRKTMEPQRWRFLCAHKIPRRPINNKTKSIKHFSNWPLPLFQRENSSDRPPSHLSRSRYICINHSTPYTRRQHTIMSDWCNFRFRDQFSTFSSSWDQRWHLFSETIPGNKRGICGQNIYYNKLSQMWRFRK